MERRQGAGSCQLCLEPQPPHPLKRLAQGFSRTCVPQAPCLDHVPGGAAPRWWHCLPQANQTRHRVSPTKLGEWLPLTALAFPLYTLSARPELPFHPQGKPNSSGHTPTTLCFRLLHPLSETVFQWMQHTQAPQSFPCTNSPHTLPQATSSQVLGKAPPVGLHTGVNLASSEKCLYSEARTRPPNRNTPHPAPDSRAALLAQTQSGKGRGTTWEPEVYTQNPGTHGWCLVNSKGTQRSSW